MKIILSDTGIDFKSKNLISEQFKQVNLPFLKLLKSIIFNKNVYCFHVRYLHLKSPFKSCLRYAIIFTILRLKRIPIIWSMHNYYEHNSKSYYVNSLLRKYLFEKSKSIVVFHKSIVARIPDKYKTKVMVSNFGTIKNILNNKRGEEDSFIEKYEKWEGAYNIDVLIVSAAKNNKYKEYVDNIRLEYNVLIINANDFNDYSNENVFLYRGFVFESLEKIVVNNKRPIIGMVFHNNISVATSYYLYSEYKIPVITNDIIPNPSIIKKYCMGISVNDPSEINTTIELINNNYSYYSSNSEGFILHNTWEKGRSVYNEILEEIDK